MVGPQLISFGSPDSDEQLYGTTPTIGATTTAPTPGSGYTLKAFQGRVKDVVRIRYEFSQTSAGSGGSGTYLFPLPVGLSADTSKVDLNTVGLPGAVVGFGQVTNSSGSGYAVAVVLYNATNLALVQLQGSGSSFVGSGNIPMSNAVAGYNLEATVPILGWSSAVRMSQPDATRTVAFRAHLASNQTGIGTSATQVQISTVDEDTHGQYGITAYSYVIPVAGYYNFSYLLLVTSVTAAAGYIAYITKNGTQIGGTSEYVASSSGNYISGLSESLSFSCNAGDVITIYSNTTGGTFTILSGAYFCGHRIAGPERIAASEKVLADYNNTSGQATTTSYAAITGWTKVTDTHGAFSGGTFTAPRAGNLRVECQFNYLTANNITVQLNINSGSRLLTFYGQSDFTSLAKTFAVNAGDTVQVLVKSNIAGNFTSTAGDNSISFTME